MNTTYCTQALTVQTKQKWPATAVFVVLITRTAIITWNNTHHFNMQNWNILTPN